MEARENDEANVCMPKDDIREEQGMVIVEDVTDMELEDIRNLLRQEGDKTLEILTPNTRIR